MPSSSLPDRLSRTEQLALWLGDQVARRAKTASTLWNLTVISPLVCLATGRRLEVHGKEHLKRIGARAPLLLVANHRSRYDFFLVTALVRYHSGLFRHFFFPVRANFFYDHPLGVLVNLATAGMGMFPPFFREPSRHQHNLQSLARCVHELGRVGRVVGIHPEGTRNRDPDPTRLRDGKPGVGKILLEASQAHALPVFVHGLSDNLFREFARALRPRRYPVFVLFGNEVIVDDLRVQGSRPLTQKRATDRCMAAIQRLADSWHIVNSQRSDPWWTAPGFRTPNGAPVKTTVPAVRDPEHATARRTLLRLITSNQNGANDP